MRATPVRPRVSPWTLPLVLAYLALCAIIVLTIVLYGTGLVIPAILSIASIGGILNDGIRE